MEKIKKVLEKVKRSPVTLDSALRSYFEKDTFQLKEFRGSFEEMMIARATIHLRNHIGCINKEIEQLGFGSIAAVIKSCPDKIKLIKKGSKNADTSSQRRRNNA